MLPAPWSSEPSGMRNWTRTEMHSTPQQPWIASIEAQSAPAWRQGSSPMLLSSLVGLVPLVSLSLTRVETVDYCFMCLRYKNLAPSRPGIAEAGAHSEIAPCSEFVPSTRASPRSELGSGLAWCLIAGLIVLLLRPVWHRNGIAVVRQNYSFLRKQPESRAILRNPTICGTEHAISRLTQPSSFSA